MKNLKFVDLCKGSMFLLIGIGIASFGIASISNNSAKADSPNTVNSTGKIMLDAEVVNLNGKVFYSVIAWDTETGKSSLYSINYSATTPAFQKESSNLPSSPLY
jgi:hypothetical protein